MPRLPSPGRPVWCGLLLAALFAAGCFPSAAWLPDSGGIVFTERDGRRLVRYDLKTRQRRVLVEDTKTCTLWPAVSPDGRWVAVAAWQRRGRQPGRLQVIVHDSTTGAEAWRSRNFAWPAHKNASGLGPTRLAWLTEERLVVDAGQTALYDRTRDRLIRPPGSPSWLLSPAAVRPAGQGFLAAQVSDDRQELVFVDWHGKVRPLHGDFPLNRMVFAPVLWKRQTVLLGGPLRRARSPAAAGLVWDRDSAILHGERLSLRVDLRKGTITRSSADRPAVLPAKGELQLVYPFPGSQTFLCVYGLKRALPGGNEESSTRLDLHDLRTKMRRVLLDRGRVSPVFSPSPDGRMVAIRHYPDEKTGKVLILDSAGNAVADFAEEE